MAIKRSVVLAGVISAALIGGSSAFAFTNGILGGHRADAVGSYTPVGAESSGPGLRGGTSPPVAPPAPPAGAVTRTTTRATVRGDDQRDEYERSENGRHDENEADVEADDHHGRDDDD